MIDSQDNSGQEPPRIEFPCEGYPIKVMGYAEAGFREHVLTVIERYAPGFDASRTTVRDSRNGRFQALTVFITATGTDQLQAIFVDLKTNPLVQMVL